VLCSPAGWEDWYRATLPRRRTGGSRPGSEASSTPLVASISMPLTSSTSVQAADPLDRGADDLIVSNNALWGHRRFWERWALSPAGREWRTARPSR